PATVYNNIFVWVGAGNEGAGPYQASDAAVADYNLIVDYDGSAKTGYSEEHGINGGYAPEDIFVDPANGDLRLKAGSPAIGAGLNLAHLFSDDYAGDLRGDVWDMGAYAYAPIPPTPGSVPACV